MDIVIHTPMLYGINIVAAVAILVVGKWLAGRLNKLFQAAMGKHDVGTMLSAFIANIAYCAMIAFIFIVALGTLGIQTASFVAVLSAAGLAIALAFQESLSNLAAGVTLVTFRPFNLGDFIEVAGVSGKVEQISIFTTTILTGDNKSVIIPNATLSAGTITNYSANLTRRVEMVFGAGYSDDLEKVRNIIEEVLANDERVLDEPAATVAVVELADSSVNFVVRPWMDSADYWPVHFATHELLKKRFDAEGINILYPQTYIYLHQAA